MAFNIMDLITQEIPGQKESFKIEYIDISKIATSQNNFYSVEEIGALKDSILLYGLQQNLVVKKITDIDGYELISGERRLTALRRLVRDGFEEFAKVPCRVEYDISEIKSELQLIFANSTTRILSSYEKTQQAKRIKELLIELKKTGAELPGSLRDIVAESLSTSTTQVARMENINNNLSVQFKKQFKEDKINFSVANELAGLPAEEQEKIYDKYKEKGNLEIKDVKEVKEQLNIEQNEDTEKMDGQLEIKNERMRVTHDLKTLPEYYEACIDLRKRFDVRKKDRDFVVGDIVVLHEFDGHNFTGRRCEFLITYILDDERFCKDGYIVLGIDEFWEGEDGCL